MKADQHILNTRIHIIRYPGGVLKLVIYLLNMAYFNYYNKYPNALDELHSQVTPEQFVYLLSVLSLDDSPEDTSLSVDTDDSSLVDSNKCSWNPNDDSQQSSLNNVKMNYDTRRRKGGKQGDDNVRTTRSKLQAELTHQQEMISKNQLVLPLSKLSGRPNLLQMSSFDSSHTMTNATEEVSFLSRYTATTNDSMMALQGASSSFEENLFLNIHSVQRKYAEIPLPLVVFQQDDNQEESKLTKEVRHKSCSKLPACKKIVGKYRNRNERESRSSSVETVKAESLPDLDNPLVNIAGKIANEPKNRFPVLKKLPFKKSSHTKGMTSTYKRLGVGSKGSLDVHRIEQDIGRELEMHQDYKDVSEFFSRKKSHNAHLPRARKGISYLAKPVTNPLYKAYNPAGYQKSEDELAFECIQMVCDDFNKWIASLASSKRKICDKLEHARDHALEDVNAEEDQDDDAPVIGPDFLIQILRTELELPEKGS